MNTLIEISNKITQCSQNDKLEIIISLRVFLFDHPYYYWINFQGFENFEKDLLKLQNLCPTEIRKFNEDNIKKIKIKPIDLFLLPKNKKIQLINLIDEIFDDYQIKVIFDKTRLDPFAKDELYHFLLSNKNDISKEIINLYENRNKDVNALLSEANIESQIYETCFTLSRKNKVSTYWINIWGHPSKYKESSLIEHLIIK